uniref:ead/Ea22-like family protein n=1 Tax=Serratia bockelmannii TaxID=2703793 RepID=UPI002360BEA3
NKLSELKSAAIAATPGPWILDDDSWSEGDNANVSTEERYDGRIVSIAQIEGGGSESGFDEPFSSEQQANARYIAAANPAVVLELLAELEHYKQYAKERDAENEGLALTVGRLRAELEAKDERIEELEAQVKVWESAATKHLARAEEAEKRLPILEQDKLRLNEIINSEANRADEAEKLLATPVRLSQRYETAGYCIDEHYCQEAADGDYLDRDELIASLHEQGFTVEGDE